MKVVFDTNALLIPFEFALDPYEAVNDLVPGAELVTLEECVNELKKLKPNWESIMTLAIQHKLKIIPSGINECSVDNTIVAFAQKEKCLVLTQDALLRRKLLAKGLRVILMRRKKTFIITG